MGVSTTEQFITKSKCIHGDNKFGYDRVVYKSAKEDVELFCIECGVYFFQKPRDHYRGGHIGCSKNNPYTIESIRQYIKDRPEEFSTIELLSTEYTSARTPLLWRCLLCGREYWANWDNTRRCGKRCKPCSSKKTRTPLSEVLEFMEIHKNKFKNIVINNKETYEKASNIEWHCLTCGRTWKSQWSVMMQKVLKEKTTTPCVDCQKEERRITIKELQDELKQKPEIYDKITLLSTEVKTKNDPLEWGCLICAHTWSTQWHHIIGGETYKATGCPECARQTLPGYYNETLAERHKCKWDLRASNLYIIVCFDDISTIPEAFYKIGIAKNTKRRFNSKTTMPYTSKIIYELNTTLYKAVYIEKYLHKLFKDKQYIPNKYFAGHTECFTEIPPIEEIEKHIQYVLKSIENNTHRAHLN